MWKILGLPRVLRANVACMTDLRTFQILWQKSVFIPGTCTWLLNDFLLSAITTSNYGVLCDVIMILCKPWFIPSRVSGRGYKIGPVCVSVCVSVCLSVIQLSHGWTVWRTDQKFGVGFDIDNISDVFKGQGHRSKVKVTRLKNVILDFQIWPMQYMKCIFVMHVKGLSGKNTNKEGKTREGASTLRRFHFELLLFFEFVLTFVLTFISIIMMMHFSFPHAWWTRYDIFSMSPYWACNSCPCNNKRLHTQASRNPSVTSDMSDDF